MDFFVRIIAVLASITIAQTQECHLKTREDLPKEHQPLYLKPNDLSPAEPVKVSNKPTLVLHKGENLTLACNGEGNYLLSGGKAVSNAVCERDGGFSIEGRQVSLKTITCKNIVRPMLKELHMPCGHNAKLYESGFQVGNNSWLKVLRACYDHHVSATRYVQHVVEPTVLEGSVQGNSRPSFKEGIRTLYKGLYISNLYKKAKQKEMFDRQLDMEEYTDNDQYLTKGHLAADADYIYSNYQHATYFFVNAAPQWQSINAGNWALVERRTRQIAGKKGRKASVTTGTQGVLKLKDSSGIPQSIYLDYEGARVPVPMYFWKAVVIGSEGIVFVGSNNPFDGLPKPPICKDICPIHGWKFTRDMKLGKIICCTVEEAKHVLQHFPNIKANAILSWR